VCCAQIFELHPQDSRAHLYGNMATWLQVLPCARATALLLDGCCPRDPAPRAQIPYRAWQARTPSKDRGSTEVPIPEVLTVLGGLMDSLK
jgi:hypothetical protein